MEARSKVDYAKVVSGYQAVVIGETHHATEDYQREATSSLKLLKELGFTHFGMEMLQTDIDPKREKAAANHIGETFYPGHTKLYQEAKRIGFEIIPLDMPIAEQQKPQRSGNSDALYRARNIWMADAAMTYLKKKLKCVLFMHHGHAIGSTGNLRVPDRYGVVSLLRAKQVATVYIQLAGGSWKASTCAPRGSDISNLAQRDNAHNTLFMAKGGTGIDHVVHLPQHCDAR